MDPTTAHEASGWISVTDRLPELRREVLVCLANRMVFMAWSYGPDTWWETRLGFLRRTDYTPTHWMPLPDPPKENL